MNRYRILKQGFNHLLGATVAIAISASAANAAENLKGREIVLWVAGGALTNAEKELYAEPFERATGAKVRLIEVPYDEMLAVVAAQVKSGNVVWDGLTSIDGPLIPKLVSEGIIQKINAKEIPGIDVLPDSAVSDYGIGTLNAAVVASYRQVKGVTPLKSVKDFFDPSIKGPRSAGGTAGDASVMCVLALLADGEDIDKMAPLDIKRCLEIWGRIKGQVVNWWQSGAEMAQVQIDEEVDYCLCFDGRVIQAWKANPKWAMTHEGGVQFFSYFVYVNGTKNSDVLNAYVSHALDPKAQAEYTKIAGYSAPNPESAKYLPDDLKPFLSVSPKAQAGLTSIPDTINNALVDQQDAIGEAWLGFISQ